MSATVNNTFHIIHFENLINELKNIECFKEIVDFNNYPTLNASSCSVHRNVAD